MNVINVCGFSFCGKTAAHDFFSDSPEIFVWPGSTETQINRFPGGLSAIWKNYCRNGSLAGSDLQQTSKLFHARLSQDPEIDWKYFHPETRKWLNKSIAEVQNFYGNFYNDLISRFLEELMGFCEPAENPDKGQQELLTLLRGFSQQLVNEALRLSGKKFLLWNNLFHPFHYEDRILFPGIRTVVLERDVRDQLTDMVSDPAFTNNAQNMDRFVQEHRSFRQKFAEQGGFATESMAELWKEGLLTRKDGDMLIYVAFEDFILRPEIRDEVCRTLGLDAGFSRLPQGRQRFDPQRSARNIGKFNALPPEKIAAAQRDLKNYIRG